MTVKQQLFAQFARIGKACSNPNRLELMDYLAQGEHSVERLAQKSGLSFANTSQHLQQLRQAGLVDSRKQGQHVIYSLSGDDVVSFIAQLRSVGERHLAEVHQLIDRYLHIKDGLEPLAAQGLLERVRQGEVMVLDVRPADEYQAGHVKGAINIPLIELEAHLADLPRDQEIIAYCRGPHCILSFEAVEKLRQQGFTARRLENGYPEWRHAGMPIECEN